MEREPEENHDGAYCDQSPDTLPDLLGRHAYFARIDPRARARSLSLTGIGQAFLIRQKDDQRYEHGCDSYPEGIVEAGGESAQIAVGESRHVGRRAVAADFGGQRGETLRGFGRKVAPEEAVAQLRQVGIVEESLGREPPVPHSDSHHRSEDGPYVDEHVEEREPRVAHLAVLLVIVHLSYERLKISFEQTVAERDREQSDACDGQIQR